MPRGRPRESGNDALQDFFDKQHHRIFERLWVTLPHGHEHVSAGERKLLAMRRESLLDAHEALAGLHRSALEVEVRR